MNARWLIVVASILSNASPAWAAELRVGEITFIEEDARGELQPRAPEPYRPGDNAGILVDIGGYATDAAGAYHLKLEVSFTDAVGKPIAAGRTHEIKDTEADRSDIHQTFFVTIPVYLPTGSYRLRLTVADVRAKRTASTVAEIAVQRGKPLVPATALVARELAFARAEDGPALAPVTFRPGETLHYRFELAGMQFRNDRPDLTVGVKLIAPDGKVAYDEPALFQFGETMPYHPNTFFLPIAGHFDLPAGFPPGTYKVEWQITDKHAPKAIRLAGSFAVAGAAAVGELRITCQQAESKDGPVRASAPYRPGDDIFIRCETLGYTVDAKKQARLQLTMTAADPGGLQLLEPIRIDVNDKVDASPQPPITGKFRLSLPQYVPAGRYTVTITAADPIAGKSVRTAPAFEVQRAAPPVPAAALTVRSFAYSDAKNGPARAPAAFRPGETLFYRFELAGFKFRGNDPDVHVSYRLLGPAGNVLGQIPDLVHLKQAAVYHPPTSFVPIAGHLALPQGVDAGTYTNEFVVTDNVAGKSLSYKATFTVAGGTAGAANKSAAAPAAAGGANGTELIATAQAGDLARVKALLAAGTDANARHGDQQVTSLVLAAQNGHVEIVKALLAAGANPNLKTVRGNTPLMQAAGSGHEAIVRLLLDARADPNSRREDGQTALIGAAHDGHIGTVRALLAARADPNAAVQNGWNALLFAAQNGHTGVVRALLAGGANPNHEVPGRGVTALYMAAQNNHSEVVRALLAARANPRVRTNDGATALAVAQQRKHDTIVALLQKAGAK